MFDFMRRNGRIGLKENIIQILSKDFPLSIKQLITKHYKTTNIKVSYQAVHKETQNLLTSGVLVREGNSYLLNAKWIKESSEFFSETEKTYARTKRLHPNIITKVQNDGDFFNIEFSTINELDEFFVSVMDAFEELAQGKEIIMHYRHNWYPLLYAKKEGEILENDPDKRKFYCLCGGNTVLDNWSGDYERSIGMNVKYKKDIGQKWDIQVYGDAIVQFHLDPQVLERIDAFFEKNKKFLEYSPKELLSIMALTGKFSVMIYRNELLAGQLRKETLAEFSSQKPKSRAI